MMQRRGRPPQVGRESAILSATLHIVAAQGLGSVSYRSVAAQSGVPVGSMTFYYATRDELLFSAFDQFVTQSLEIQRSTFTNAEHSVVDRLVELVMGTHFDSEYRILLAELYVLSYRDDRYRALTRQWMEGARIELERVLPSANARIIDALQEGLVQQRHFAPEEIDHDSVREAFSKLIDPVDADRTENVEL